MSPGALGVCTDAGTAHSPYHLMGKFSLDAVAGGTAAGLWAYPDPAQSAWGSDFPTRKGKPGDLHFSSVGWQEHMDRDFKEASLAPLLDILANYCSCAG